MVVLSPMAAAALAVAVERTRVAAAGAAPVAAVAVARAEAAAEEDCWTSRTPRSFATIRRHRPARSDSSRIAGNSGSVCPAPGAGFDALSAKSNPILLVPRPSGQG